MAFYLTSSATVHVSVSYVWPMTVLAARPRDTESMDTAAERAGFRAFHAARGLSSVALTGTGLLPEIWGHSVQ